MKLLEQYKQRLDVSEKYFQNTHAGQKLDGTKKLTIATCLNNINKFMESFVPAQATQGASAGINGNGIGDWKRFCLNVTTLGLPNLIAPEIVLTKPMPNYTGYVAFTDFVAGDAKGGVQEGDLLNGVYALGKMTEDRQRYTSANVVETADAEGEVVAAWTPIAKGSFLNEGVAYDAKITTKTGDTVTITYANFDDDNKLTGLTEGAKVAYVYDNVVIPQQKLVHLKAVMHHIQLRAKCRRIAITYSQIAAFQYKTDYEGDLNQQLVAQASGELAYEIDAEVIDLLRNAAHVEKSLSFSRKQPIGVSLRDHYEAFGRTIERAKSIIYNRTGKFAPNFMVVASDCLDVLSMSSQWHAAPTGAVYGPYFAGTYGPFKVYVAPVMDAGEVLWGVVGNDLATAAAIYAPYMPVVPTQLLGLPDGTMTQGFATMYDLKLLARCNFNGDEIEIGYDAEGNTVGNMSPLLVKGYITD